MKVNKLINLQDLWHEFWLGTTNSITLQPIDLLNLMTLFSINSLLSYSPSLSVLSLLSTGWSASSSELTNSIVLYTSSLWLGINYSSLLSDYSVPHPVMITPDFGMFVILLDDSSMTSVRDTVTFLHSYLRSFLDITFITSYCFNPIGRLYYVSIA